MIGTGCGEAEALHRFQAIAIVQSDTVTSLPRRAQRKRSHQPPVSRRSSCERAKHRLAEVARHFGRKPLVDGAWLAFICEETKCELRPSAQAGPGRGRQNQHDRSMPARRLPLVDTGGAILSSLAHRLRKERSLRRRDSP